MRSTFPFLAVLGATALVPAVLGACEKSDDASSGSSGGLDGGFGFDSSTGDASAAMPPGSDGSTSPDGATNPDAGDSLATTTLTGITPGNVNLAVASSDGSAMIVVVGGANVMTWSHYEPATGWTAGAAVPGAVAGDTRDMVIDGHGNVFLGFTSNAAGVTSLNLVRYDHATHAWSAVQHPDPYAQSVDYEFGLAANAGGEALVVTHHLGTTGSLDLVASHYVAGTWTQETITTPDATSSFTSSIATRLADNGKAIVTWRRVQGFQIATRTTAGVWTLEPPTPDGITGNPSVALNEAGDAIVGYETTNTTPGATVYNAAIATWQSPALTTPTQQSVLGVCDTVVGITTTGDATLLRCFSNGATMNAVAIEGYTYAKATSTWGAKVPLADSAPGQLRGPTFVFDKTGSGLATWVATSDAFSTAPSPLLSNAYAAGTGWGTTSAAITTKSTEYDSRAFVSPNGRGFAVWVEGSSVRVKKIR